MHLRAPTAPLPTTGPFPEWPLDSVIQFKALPMSFEPTTSASIFSEDYTPNSWIPLAKSRADYPGGVDAFDERIIGLLMIEVSESGAFSKLNQP